ncbi:MAG: hypothetical protein UX39_C0013G0015 [Candidatus Magasanikbacteria bacterium GW2011_GWA2_46_17]|uniref:DUF4012 domain-containing protein n=1 Tax=Candidatus Magasanikbacteria bacterium GW2011_GWA2_46_17 TaxID=1619042 RepID=A0A0G1R7M1_9BACT|nr:MAG: hypothetical protein UX39_C0013G0015 [Candidatus Magasanikbacteria bacterium GW2011_GWA2_46_17]
MMVIFIVVLGLGVVGWRMYKTGKLQEALVQKLGSRVFEKQEEMNLVYQALGFKEPRTYLVLFLNNTEMRPGGGFIGAYAAVRVDKGTPHILKVEGTEILDNRAPRNVSSPPPEALKKYLYIERWNFRDSNWSPDFASSAAKAMELYALENGTAASEITGVIGITPTVLQEVLRLSGPVRVGGELYTADNVVQKLEYEVEYGYARRGISFDDRKKVLADMTHALVSRLRYDVFRNWSKYLGLAGGMAKEKHIIVFALEPDTQRVLMLKNWAGTMKSADGDYLLWADANLASLKTDLAMDRELSYSITPTSSGRAVISAGYMAKVKMKYIHKGKFDQFTTRYRTYARVYTPMGTVFYKVKGSLRNDRTTDPGTVDQGVENGRQWFGAFISIEPGKTGELEWQFYLSPRVSDQIRAGTYKLLAQKQIGTIANGLTLNLNFGKKVIFASPGEPQDQHGDTQYRIAADLREDREFEVKLDD